MGKPRRKKPRCCAYEEVSSVEWEAIAMTQQEEDIIYRMYRLVGDRWDLIAGRIPGRKPEDIERFWIMRHDKRAALNCRGRSQVKISVNGKSRAASK